MIAKTIYGENKVSNAGRHVLCQMDQSGITSTPYWDSKGNCLSRELQLPEEYPHDIDWQKPVKLDGKCYTSAAQYDALNRITTTRPSQPNLMLSP